MRRGELVAFMFAGHFCLAPVLQVNRKTVRVQVSAGERLIPRDRLLPRMGPCNDPLELWFVEFYDGELRRSYHADRREAATALRARKRASMVGR